MPTILLLSGPNLNLFGEREPSVYGTDTLDDMVRDAREAAAARGYEVEHVQSNHEGDLVDALATFEGVKVELHVSNPAAREAWRAESVLSPFVTGVVAGFGRAGYRLAVDGALAKLGERA